MKPIRRLFYLSASLILLFFCLPACQQKVAQTSFSWVQTDTSVVLLNRREVVWQFNYPDIGKPYFHPLNTPGGTSLTWIKPPDHPWHYGLWFSWKYINEVNFWEEDPQSGLSEGWTKVQDIRVLTNDDISASIFVQVGYGVAEENILLSEERRIDVSSPGPDSAYWIDWISTFTAEQNVELERTPVPGQEGGVSWGGYGGLGYRIDTRSFSNLTFTDDAGRLNLEITGEPTRWVNAGGNLVSDTTQMAGITIFDHPQNINHPVPGYIIHDWLEDFQLLFGYMNPGIIYEKGLLLDAGEQMTLRYRIFIHDGPPDHDRDREVFSRFDASASTIGGEQ